MDEFNLISSYILIGLIGLCVGSFLNVVIYRLPNNMSLSRPGSHCTKCRYELRWYDNIPVVSYLMLGGKCRSCKAQISWRYPAVELSHMLLWLMAAFVYWQKNRVLAVVYMLTFSVYTCIFFIDIDHQLIFDRFQIVLLLLAVVTVFVDKEYGWPAHLIGGVGGFAFFYLISAAFSALMKKEGLGGGDIKLVGVTGLMLGWERLLLSILLATIPAAVMMTGYTALRRDHEQADACAQEELRFPFAPFLVFGFTVALLFGKPIIEWYLSLMGL